MALQSYDVPLYCMLLAELNSPTRLSVTLGDGNTSLYCRATILTSAGAVLTTLSLPHTTLGVYANDYTFSTVGQYVVVYKLYTDAGFTIPAIYDQGVDQVDVSHIKTDLSRLLGLLHENTVIDQQTYDANGFLISSRIRAYDTKANADLAGATGLLYTWSMSATFTNMLLSSYKIVKE